MYNCALRSFRLRNDLSHKRDGSAGRNLTAGCEESPAEPLAASGRGDD
jgi:hypothetical protein